MKTRNIFKAVSLITGVGAGIAFLHARSLPTDKRVEKYGYDSDKKFGFMMAASLVAFAFLGR